MEVLLKKPVAAGDEKTAELKAEAEASMAKELAAHRRSLGASSPSSSPAKKSLTSKEQEDELESTRAEMVEAREENERLRVMLARILNDYESLQGQFMDMVQQQPPQQQQQKEQYFSRVDPVDLGGVLANGEEPDLVSLRLGTAATIAASAGGRAGKDGNASTSASWGKKDVDLTMGGELTLGMDCKVEGSSSASTPPTTVNVSTENSLEDPKDNDACVAQWPPGGKVAAGKSVRRPGDDEVSQHIQIKKARVSVRTRCDGPTMNDGCQWRKYGQKISKANPCPRAYYRCTVAPACPVRKQVQRCAEDMSILITTYEGTHNHPLPMSAAAMASTTAVAASMLVSGPSASRPGILSSPFAATAATSSAGSLNPSATPLHGLNFSFSDASRAKPYFLPHAQPMTTTPTHPTITLDFTSPLPSTGATTATASAAFNRYPSPFASSIQRYPASLSFSSSNPNTSQSPWNQLYGSKSQASRSPYQSPYLMRNSSSMAAMMQTQQQPLSDSLAKAITLDPNFKSALAAAITSIVGGQGAQISAGGQLSSLSSLTTATAATTATTLANRLLADPSSSFFLPAPLKMEKLRDYITKQSSS